MGFGGLKGALASLLAARATCALFTLLNGSSHRERALLGSWVRCHVPLLLLITLLTRIIHHLSLHVMPRAPPSLRHHPLGQKHRHQTHVCVRILRWLIHTHANITAAICYMLQPKRNQNQTNQVAIFIHKIEEPKKMGNQGGGCAVDVAFCCHCRCYQ